MSFLIRKIISSAGGRQGYQDYEVATSPLTIGRGTDQDLLLPGDRVAFRHAEITFANGQTRLRSLAAVGVVVNGRTCQYAVLNIGDQVLIGDFHLVVIPSPDDEIECALTVQQLQPQAYDGLDPAAYRTELGQLRWLRTRSLSWLLFLLVLGGALLIPLWLSLNPDVKAEVVGLPDDSVWVSGPMHRVHAFMGEDCQACHKAPFEQVPDRACAECHQQTARHVPADHPAEPLFGFQRCATCHREHNGQARLVLEDQRFCADCHRVIASVLGPYGEIRNVSDFSTGHPEFRLSLLKPELREGDWHWLETTRTEVTATLQETSHLAFDHQLHLDPEGVKAEDGNFRVLDCSSCHQPEVSGPRMVPVRMEEHCAGCHSLAFDPERPARVVPHGPPEKVIDSLREYFSVRFIEQNLAKDTQVRRPGAAQDVARLQREGTAWVEARTREVAEDMFERRACATCHVVERIPNQDFAWTVRPVRLSTNWMHASTFPHDQHRNQECGSCHQAEASEQSSDILMPPIATCRECHGGAQGGQDDRVLSTCVACHRYHQPDAGLMVERQ